MITCLLLTHRPANVHTASPHRHTFYTACVLSLTQPQASVCLRGRGVRTPPPPPPSKENPHSAVAPLSSMQRDVSRPLPSPLSSLAAPVYTFISCRLSEVLCSALQKASCYSAYSCWCVGGGVISLLSASCCNAGGSFCFFIFDSPRSPALYFTLILNNNNGNNIL